VRVNPETRPSRLISSIPEYLRRSVLTIVRIFMTYRPFRFFALLGLCSLAVGLIPSIRFLYYYFTANSAGHIQSLIFGVLFLGTGVSLIVVGLLADLIGVNRQLLEDLRWRVRNIENELADKNRKT